MKKMASTLPNMILSLGTITILAGALLGWIYSLTKEPIARQEAEQQQMAIAAVTPRFDNDPEAEKWTTTINGNEFTVYPARENGTLVGAAVKGTSMEGFAGEIIVMCGFKADGTVNDYRVLRQAETPGLGTKMETWFRDPAGARSVIGRNPGDNKFTVSKDGGEVDGITAATISSRAFLGIMRNAFEAYREFEKKSASSEENAETSADASSASKNYHK